MIKREEKKRLSLWISTTLYNRLDSDSKRYGIPKTAIVQTAVTNYYRSADAHMERESLPVCQGARTPAGVRDAVGQPLTY